MIRINIPWIIDVTTALDRLDNVRADMDVSTVFYDIFSAKQNVEIIFQQSIYNQHIKVSRQKAAELIEYCGNLLAKDVDYKVSELDEWIIKYRRDGFRQLFLAEVSAMPAYMVSRKEGYDVDVLIDAGIALFPPSLLTKAPETEKDARQVGSALAFEIATGCGFHVFRVTEAVVKRYWDEVSGGKKRPKLQTLGSFAVEMEKERVGDEKIIESLKQLTRLHRNPIIHPEVLLTVEEAIGIIGMARSVIGAMLSLLPDVPPTTVVQQPPGG